MLKRSVIVHLVWALIAGGALVGGLQLARVSRGLVQSEAVTIPPATGKSLVSDPADSDQSGRYVPLPGSVGGKPEATPILPESQKSSASVERTRKLQTARRTMAREASAAQQKTGPLGKSEIQSLVQQAVKAPSALGRRQAFDRILEEMGSSTFSREQAFMMRGAMAKAGVDGKLWQLFDYAWGANDPATAVAHLDEIPERYFEGFLGNMIPGLASVDPQAAIDVFSGLDPGVASRVQRRLFEGLIDNDVEVATNFIYDVTDPRAYNWRPMDTLTREIVRDQGLDVTLDWATELPEGALRSSAWSAAFAHWGSREPERAIESIMEMEPSPDRNQALNGFTAAFAHQDGSMAVEWANEITEPGLRQGALTRAFTQFHRQNPQAAAESFSSIDVPRSVWHEATGQAWSGGVQAENSTNGGSAAEAAPAAN